MLKNVLMSGDPVDSRRSWKTQFQFCELCKIFNIFGCKSHGIKSNLIYLNLKCIHKYKNRNKTTENQNWTRKEGAKICFAEIFAGMSRREGFFSFIFS